MDRFDKLKAKHTDAQNEYADSLMRVANEAGRVAEVARNADKILDEIDAEFEQTTKLTKTDIKLLLLAVGLQCCRQYLLSNDALRISASDGDKLIEKTLKKTPVLGKRKDIIEILTSSVPYDATKRSETYLETFGKLSTGLSGTTHRYRTLGHDPILGWLFGTANILTDSLTKSNFIETYTVVNMKIDLPFSTGTIGMLATAQAISTDDPKLLFTALCRQAIHFGSDYFTKQGLPVPVIPSLSNGFSQFLMTRCNVDIRALSRSAAFAMLINKSIEFLHALFYDEEKDGARDLYKVRTRKIILYSNTIATASNILYVAISAALGNEAALKKLDIGGFLVTLHRLISDTAFIRDIKREFLEKEFYERVMGDFSI